MKLDSAIAKLQDILINPPKPLNPADRYLAEMLVDNVSIALAKLQKAERLLQKMEGC